ncbi:hypothetical protein RHGRI_016811 [Rhododendron griersonianum]|uniref:Uncharacterized protein n=1 Tax=Rhododendron griersonianum TaxID=479676 RepID=A0AAV6JVR1_9ERIC|nr:hypothetical protein RHGRI_016811 [Rhododendron griersonianum]
MELVDEGEGDRLRYGLVEHGSRVRREIWISEIELPWLCLILEDASSDYNKDFVRSYGSFARKIHASFSSGKGFCLEGGGERFREGVVCAVARVVWKWGVGGYLEKNLGVLCYRRSEGIVEGRSFLEAASIGGWPENTVAVEEKGEKRRGCDVDVRADSMLE